MKLLHALLAADPKYKKQKKYAEEESDMDEDAVAEHEEACKAREIERVEKKFAKENEKLAEEGKDTQDDDVLRSRLGAVEDEFARLEKERGTGKATLKRDRPAEKLVEAIDKLEDKIKAFKLQMVDREAGKEVALGTSKINYLDPRWADLCRVFPLVLLCSDLIWSCPFLPPSLLWYVGSLRRGARSTMCRSRRYFRRHC
jgi:DNA topoisomerase-1